MFVAETMLTDFDKFPAVQLGQYTISLELDPLSPKYEEIAKNELRETPETKQEAIEQLRKMLQADTDLLVPYNKDTWLVKFLRPCKFYPESAFQLIKRYFAFKQKHADIFDGLVPSKETNFFEHDIMTVQPIRDQHGRRIVILELGKKWKHKKCSLDEIFKGCVLLLETALLEPTTQVAGAIVMFDMDGLTLQQTWQFTPSFAKRIVDFLQDACPIRLKNLHVVNEPYIFNMVFALFKPFLKEKLKSRIIFHGTDRKSLHKYLNPDCLPPAYGGTLEIPRVPAKLWFEILQCGNKEYEALNSYGYNKKR